MPRRSKTSYHLSRGTKNALTRAQAYQRNLQGLEQHPDALPVLEALRADVEILSRAPALRISASRSIQSAGSRRATAVANLFDACSQVRRRIKLQFRASRYAELQQAFGVGMFVCSTRPQTVLDLAAKILDAAPHYQVHLRAVRILPPSLQRIAKLRDKYLDADADLPSLRTERRLTRCQLSETAHRAHLLCDALLMLEPVKA